MRKRRAVKRDVLPDPLYNSNPKALFKPRGRLGTKSLTAPGAEPCKDEQRRRTPGCVSMPAQH